MRFYASSGDKARLTALPERGIVNIEGKDENGSSALHWAAHEGRLSCLEVLLEKGSDVMAKGARGWTAVEFAKNGDHTACVAVLEEAMRE